MKSTDESRWRTSHSFVSTVPNQHSAILIENQLSYARKCPRTAASIGKVHNVDTFARRLMRRPAFA